jgi:hypothetical protein
VIGKVIIPFVDIVLEVADISKEAVTIAEKIADFPPFRTILQHNHRNVYKKKSNINIL